MKTIEIDTGGYAAASYCLRDANMWAAHYLGELGDGLADTGEMAGDSSFAEPFATGYDESARLAVQTWTSLVTSYANLGRYAFASVENHTRAELASVLGGGPVVTDSPELSADAWYEVAPRDLPSSLGGDPSSLPDWANWLLDKIEGFVWPDADLDRLRRTGEIWRTAADHLQEIADHADFSRFLLGEMRSPEIPLAINHVNGLAAATRDLGHQCADLGDACTAYADAVEEQREAILDLAHDLIRDAILIQAGGFVLGLVTLGTANGGAAAINAAKIAAEAPRFRAMVELIRLYALEAKVALSAGGSAMMATELKLRKYVQARNVLLGERGSFKILPGAAKPKPFLHLHEGGNAGGHTLAKHVAKTDDFLRARLKATPNAKMVSTFTDRDIAEQAITKVLSEHSGQVSAWLASTSGGGLGLESRAVGSLGRVMMQSGHVVPGYTARVVLVKDASMPGGFQILTAFVKP